MPKASVKRSIECKKEQLIDLVLDIEKYPQFVPFWLESKVYKKNEKGDFISYYYSKHIIRIVCFIDSLTYILSHITIVSSFIINITYLLKVDIINL